MYIMGSKMSVRSGRLAQAPWLLNILFASACSLKSSFGHQGSLESMTDSVNVARPPLLVENKRIFGIVPNNRTWPSLKDYNLFQHMKRFEIARLSRLFRPRHGYPRCGVRGRRSAHQR
jgi:hypothetical protein